MGVVCRGPSRILSVSGTVAGGPEDVVLDVKFLWGVLKGPL